MAQEKQLQNNNISHFNGGLHTDNSLIDSPKGTYRFALNSVNETELGDFGFISNEESNEECASLTPGYVPIGCKEFGGVISVASYNPLTNKGQVGSFPSPERNISSTELSDTTDKTITGANFGIDDY